MIKLKLFISLAFFAIISANSIAQWTIQGSLTGLGGYPSISVYAPSELVVAGGTSGSPKVYKSTNSGINWVNITGNISGPELFCVWAVDANLIFVGDGGSNGGNSGNAKVWKTTNGGVNWSVILTTGGTGGFFNGIVFSRTNPLIGIAQSDPPTPNGPHYLAKSTDGGISWNTQTTISTNGAAISGTVVCIDNLFYGWGIFPPARVLLTSDGGITWNQTSISSGGNQTQGFAFSSDKMTGVAVSENTLPFISRTSNGGVTWTSLNTGTNTSFIPKLKWVYGTNVCYLIAEAGSGGCAGKSTDGGLTWSVMNTSGLTGLKNIDLVFMNGIVTAYVISGNGNLIKLIEPLSVVAIGSMVPSEYVLNQNYPNPFNPITKIRFALPKTSFAKLVIYDALGREQETLANQQLTARTYEAEWDASNYPSGVYYYKLTAGNYTETKKMILIK